MTHGSLFSGIGGFDLAAQWMGWQNLFHCEWNEFGQKVLKYYWPNAESFCDITKTDFTKYEGTIDLISGGFPCQPYSVAGKRLGKEDERHLWPEMCRAIREIKPRWVVGENVRGLISWNGGLVFHEVQTDLEAQGYEVQSFLLPACGVGAPHRRDRIWFVAKRNGVDRNASNASIIGRDNGSNNRKERCFSEDIGTTEESKSKRERWKRGVGQISAVDKPATDSYNKRLERGKNIGIIGKGGEKWNKQFTGQFCSTWENFPTVSPICNGDDGLSDKLDGITFSKWRNESIKAGGNAIVPQVAFQIFKTIEAYEKQYTS